MYGEWKQVKLPLQGGERCECDNPDVWERKWVSFDGGHEDWNYHCRNCGRDWWVDGIDA